MMGKSKAFGGWMADLCGEVRFLFRMDDLCSAVLKM